MIEYLKYFVKERFWIHLSGCIALAYLLVGWLLTHAHYGDFGVVVGALVMGFACWFIGSAWEWFWDKVTKKDNWSWADIRWSAIGGVVGAFIRYGLDYKDAAFYISWGWIIFIFLFECRRVYITYVVKKGVV